MHLTTNTHNSFVNWRELHMVTIGRHRAVLLMLVTYLLLLVCQPVHGGYAHNVFGREDMSIAEFQNKIDTYCKKGEGNGYKRRFVELQKYNDVAERRKYIQEYCGHSWILVHTADGYDKFPYAGNNIDHICHIDINTMNEYTISQAGPDLGKSLKRKKETYSKTHELVTEQCLFWHNTIAEDVDLYNKEKQSEEKKKIALRQEAERKKDDAARKAKAEALALKNKLADEKAKKEAEFTSAMNMGDDSDFVVIWDYVPGMVNTNIGSVRYKAEAIAEIQKEETNQLNRFNLMMWDNTEILIAKSIGYTIPMPTYSEPKIEKGEFEKTSEFNARKAKEIEMAKGEHANKLAIAEEYNSEALVALKAANNNKQQYYVRLLQPWLKVLLGENTRTVAYDADNERFDLTIHSEGLKEYIIDAKLGVPVEEAKLIKPEIENGKLHVLYLLKGSKLEIQRIVLRTENKAYLIADVSDNFGNFSFTIEAANAYRPIYSAALKLKEETKEQAKAEEERKRKELEKAQLAKAKKAREERVKKYGHPGPFLKASSTFCTDLKSMFKAAAIERANNPYISTPDDCAFSSVKLVPLTKVDYMAGGIARILVKNSGYAYLYTTDTSILE